MTTEFSTEELTFEGRLVFPEDDSFDEARVGRIFNLRRPDRQPAAVLLAVSEQDVVNGVRLARREGWSVAVRSGGHSWAGWSVQNGTLLIDLGLLQDKGYDDATGVVWANPAVKGGQVLSPYLEERGRFFSGGHCPTVGIGGFLLQGGQGWCQRGWGWAAEAVVAVDVVTAEGELVRADANSNADLYWAARGAGPSFPGIVTKFYLQTRPIFGFCGHTVQVYDLADFKDVMSWLYTVHATISPDVEIVVVSQTSPPDASGLAKRELVVSGVALTKTEAEAREALAVFNECPVIDRAIVVEDCRPSSLSEQRAAQEIANPEDARYVVDNLWAEGDSAEIIERIEPLFVDLPTPESFTIWFSNGIMRPLPDMAFSLQTEAYVASYMVYRDETKDLEYRQHLNRLVEFAQPITAGQYLGDSDMTNRQVKFMAEENFARLQQIIAARDPENRFVRYLAKDPATINRHHWLEEAK